MESKYFNLDVLRLIIFFSSLIIAGFCDLSFRVIPNWLTVPVTILGFIFAFFINGLNGLVFSFLGSLIGFLPFYIIYKKGGIGAGDVKLMTMVGSIFGPTMVINSIWYTSIVGFVMALYKLISLNRINSGFKNMLSIFTGKFSTSNVTIPYGVAIVIGSYIAYFKLN